MVRRKNCEDLECLLQIAEGRGKVMNVGHLLKGLYKVAYAYDKLVEFLT